MAPEYRSKIGYVLSPEIVAPLALIHSGQRRVVVLKSQPQQLTTAQKLVLASRLLAAIIFTLIGAFLVLARPSIITWSFYLLCVGLNPGPFEVSVALLSYPWVYFYYVFQDIMTVAGGLGAFLFALLFPRQSVSGWRRSMVRLAPYLFISVAALNIYADLASNYFALPIRLAAVLLSSIVVLALIVVVYAFWDTHIHTSGDDKQRIRWVIFGFTVGLTSATASFALPLSMVTPEWFGPTLLLLIVAIPLTVGYAVIRHRVIDVNFVVSRAIVYSIMTTLLVMFFAFIDWLLGKELAAGNLALTTEVTLAIAAGLGLDRLHRVIDHSVNSVLFRRRRAAIYRLAKLARKLEDAASASAVDELLVNEPSQALSLTSSAIFRRSEDGSYMRRASQGWAEQHAQALHPTEPLVLKLSSIKKPVRIDKLPWDRASFPGGPAQPALALPITIRGKNVAIGLYGAHSGGEDLAPDEIGAIDRLEPSAAAAYARVEVEALRPQLEELTRLRERVAALTQEIEMMRSPTAEKETADQESRNTR